MFEFKFAPRNERIISFSDANPMGIRHWRAQLNKKNVWEKNQTEPAMENECELKMEIGFTLFSSYDGMGFIAIEKRLEMEKFVDKLNSNCAHLFQLIAFFFLSAIYGAINYKIYLLSDIANYYGFKRIEKQE